MMSEKQAQEIEWESLPYLSPQEFSENPDKRAQPDIIYSLHDYRSILGRAFYPSPTPGALARLREEDKGSRHYAGKGRLSDAVDGFPAGNAANAFLVAITSQLFGGIGLYLDTHYDGREWPMLHLDLRPLGTDHAQETALIWIRQDGEYHYPQYSDQGTSMLAQALRIADKMSNT